MLKNFIKWFSKNTGDYNHAIIGLVIMGLASFFPAILYYVATFVSAFYLGKEHRTYIPRLGELGSFQINKWDRHDRRQSIFVWVSVWLYALAFSNF